MIQSVDKSSFVLGPLELSPLCCYSRNLPRTLGRKIPTWPLDRVSGSTSLSPFLYMEPCKRAFVCDNLRDSGTKKRWAQQTQKGGWHFISPRSRWEAACLGFRRVPCCPPSWGPAGKRLSSESSLWKKGGPADAERGAHYVLSPGCVSGLENVPQRKEQ